ncbi:Probable LRR receptor-like serine/threonine-protein kinase [Striga hermonthica]|uniref:non-specific serine/threonine protein kinase n=1 Tax=Striga hermonthica TaxID=68872 RepID=A0A9N7NVD6_STRHE|nr:Probable LRR receptor-like serine/threonine-protein kinase [Striga hermonthica]
MFSWPNIGKIRQDSNAIIQQKVDFQGKRKSRNSIAMAICYCFLSRKSNFCFFALWAVEIVAGQPKTEPREVDAINKIIDHWNLRSKLNLTGDPCNKNATWAPESANPRIACDCSDSVCHITRLKIYALDISGEIPQELFLLTELMDLDLNQNMLNGSIPSALGQLSNMQYLAFGINNFTGPVPAELGNLTKLIVLSFSSNNLEGILPPELGNLASLQQLYIDSSGVSGPIPEELSNLKSLQTLWASDNGFTGKIPEFLGSFTNLKDLRLEGTNLEGPIPRSFGALTKLQDLRIGDLSGGDSSLNFLENMTRLSTLSLRNCRANGQIPEKISSFPNLKFLDLSFNKLTGQIPASFKNFSSLQYMYLGSNNLSGDLPSEILGSELSDLIALDVSFNPLTGKVPRERKGMSINVVGTSIDNPNLNNKKGATELRCITGNSKCNIKNLSTSFAVNCGGQKKISTDGTTFEADSETLGAASLYLNPDGQFAVSSAGIYISNPNGPQYIAKTLSQITNTLDSELYQTARIAPSLRYFGLGLKNGVYRVELHFAEIQMPDSGSASWKGLGRRLFDVYIQGERVLQDFNIAKESEGSKNALVKKFKANVTNTVLDIHLLWAGKGTCCIPFQSTFGPLISAIRVSQVPEFEDLPKSGKTHVG